MPAWRVPTGAPSPRTELVYNVEMVRGSIRKGDWKLFHRAPLPSARLLFNLAEDPSETTDLAAERPEIAAALEARLQALAGEMVPSRFFEQAFRSCLGREVPAPAFPNTDACFNLHD